MNGPFLSVATLWIGEVERLGNKMHFRGWEVVTPAPSFDPEVVTFMDFRMPQEDEIRFFYVLPYVANRALVEFTVFSQRVLPRRAYEEALREHLATVLRVNDYSVDAEESGAVPITDDPLERALGRRVMAIGARAGRIKPSTGDAEADLVNAATGLRQGLCGGDENGGPSRHHQRVEPTVA